MHDRAAMRSSMEWSKRRMVLRSEIRRLQAELGDIALSPGEREDVKDELAANATTLKQIIRNK